MIAAILCLFAAAATEIQFGWQPLDKGGQEYLVEVEPELIDTFSQQGFTSDIPPQLRDIRRIRITVGNLPLPHQGETALKVPDAVSIEQPPPPPQPVASHPDLLPADSDGQHVSKQIEPPPAQPTSFDDDHSAGAAKANSAPAGKPVSPQPAASIPPASPTSEPTQPWLPLVLAIGALIASLTWNAYLGWIHWETRGRYRALVEKLRAHPSA